MSAELSSQVKGAVLLAKQGDYAAALELFDRRLEEAPSDELATYWSAMCLYKLGRLEESVYRARRVGPGPHMWGALTVESDALAALGRYDEARAAAEQLVAVAPDKVLAHTRLAWIGIKTQDAELTLSAGQRAVDLAPDSTEGLYLLAMGHSMSNQPREARWVLRKLLLLDRDNKPALHLLNVLKKRSRSH